MLAAILALILGTTPREPTLRTDIGVVGGREAWDLNQSTESVVGLIAGLDRRVWQGVAVRGEGMLLRVLQEGEDAWLGGVTLGTRVRWGGGDWRPLVDVAVGMSQSSTNVPPSGTRFNYLAVIGGGAERQVGRVRVAVTGRWLHASNNGREGRHLNPDIQALGALLSVGWEH
jgi:hypothetical protein